ncbi:ATP-dependent helicase HepA [Pseudobythopirellula maris]|uniref:ATP-dependent helicase HepA n=1 Tax=Pseudobythopirellula maris TaxID=2527991 RepID=A0A5C5ZLK7_9BACT|nr:DEAD/DEAH box helicase [Pseudobythopirellula maris]TWT87333.1 ATP-dependent helicase HepA [Pseudobythopirellula maris]
MPTPPDAQLLISLEGESLTPKPPAVMRSWLGEDDAGLAVTKVDFGATAPQVVSIAPPPCGVKTYGCLLAEGREALAARSASSYAAPRPKVAEAAAPRRDGKPAAAGKRTRIRPPGDVVKLEDRLHYLLQPPLESLLEAGSLGFPFKPFPYQLDGVAFLFPRRHAVIADEMGLGKTMQSITTVRLLAHSGQLRRVLLVCPKPLVSNWRRELALWAPDVSVAVVDGPRARREWAWRHTSAVVTIANYESVVRDSDLLHSVDGAEPVARFDMVILDEAQRIKNKNGTTSAAVCALPRDRSWALTGTPIENSTEDLVGVYEFVSPGVLRSGMRAQEMATAVRDSVLRRTKERVLKDLPPKIVRDEAVDLAPEQWDAYRRAEDEGVLELSAEGAEGGAKSVDIHHVFELVLRLKQVCNFDPASGASGKADRLEAELEECVASGRKAIVFSQWVDTIDKLAKRLGRFNPAEYHGRVPHGRRDGVIDRFRNDPDCHVILMSYGAGSVGLNLQFAGYVFLFDRWWNPAVEDQAINRAHRIGAAGPVTVTRYACAGTIEERIDAILTEKRELFDKVFSDDLGLRSGGLTRDDLLSLFDLRGPSGPIAAAA